jgi:hypothetical protein
MVPIEDTHGVVGSISMCTVRHSGPCPKIIDPIQCRLLFQDIISRKNQQHLICILGVSYKCNAVLNSRSEIISHFSACESSDSVRIQLCIVLHAIQLYIGLNEFSELDCVACLASEKEEIMLI